MMTTTIQASQRQPAGHDWRSTMPLVTMWTGDEVRALREARRMSVRHFAGHLGVSDRTVSKWEAGGASIWPRPVNQSALDTSLAMADTAAKARFARITGNDAGDNRPRRQRNKTVAVALDHVVHLLRHPLDGKPMTVVEAGPVRVRRRAVWVPEYFVDVDSVSNAEYARFLAATDHRPPSAWPRGHYDVTDDPQPRHGEPVAGLTYADVAAYARWSDKSLPTTVQLDKAASGGVIVLKGREWCERDGIPVQYGVATAPAGGFRCVSRTTAVLALLAI